MEEKLKVVLISLLIVLISLISFGGIYVQRAKTTENVIRNYKLGTDLTGERLISLIVDKSTKTVIYDKEGKVVEKETKDTTKKEEPINKKESLNIENYKKAKKIIEKRLNDMQVSSFSIRQNEKTGDMFIKLPEDEKTNLAIQSTTIKGAFSITNDENKELLNNKHIKDVKVGYNNLQNGVTVYLTINLNKEGTQIFKDITNTYKKEVDKDGKDISKKISLKIDDMVLFNTYFEDEISNGIIQLSVGAPTNNNEEFKSYIKEASNVAVLLNNDTLPISYKVEDNKYIMTDITKEMFYIPTIIFVLLILIGIIILIIKYKKNGVLSGISLIGYIATLLLLIRYANVVLTLEGIIGIVISIIMNYIFNVFLLNLIKENSAKSFKNALLKTMFILIPITIITIVMCFTNWIPIYSFGMVMFWGILLIALYNLAITKTLIVDNSEEK